MELPQQRPFGTEGILITRTYYFFFFFKIILAYEMIKRNRSVLLLTVIMKHVFYREQTNARPSFTVQAFFNCPTRSKTTFSRYYHFSFIDLVKKEQKIVSGFSKWKEIFFLVYGCGFVDARDTN